VLNLAGISILSTYQTLLASLSSLKCRLDSELLSIERPVRILANSADKAEDWPPGSPDLNPLDLRI